MAGGQRGVGERLLHQALAVVEGAVDSHRRDVVAEGGELRLLDGAHPAARVEHDDAGAGHAVEGVRHCPAGVARRGDQHGDRRSRPRRGTSRRASGPCSARRRP